MNEVAEIFKIENKKGISVELIVTLKVPAVSKRPLVSCM